MNIVIKDTFFVTCNDVFLETGRLSALKEYCPYGYVIFLSLLTKCIKKQNAQLVVDWDVLRLSTNSRVLLRGLHSSNSLKASSSRSDERPGLSSSLNDVSPEKNNFEN